MIFLLRGLPVLVEVGLLIYGVVDAFQTPQSQVRNLPKWAWVLLILVIPLVGGIAWLVAGRPARGSARHESGSSESGSFDSRSFDAGTGRVRHPRSGRQLAPDDDEAFLAGLRPRTDGPDGPDGGDPAHS